MDRLRTRVRVTMGPRKGRIVIDVGSPEELDRIVSLVGDGEVVMLPDGDAARTPPDGGHRLAAAAER
jgi:hypothetical protein